MFEPFLDILIPCRTHSMVLKITMNSLGIRPYVPSFCSGRKAAGTKVTILAQRCWHNTLMPKFENFSLFCQYKSAAPTPLHQLEPVFEFVSPKSLMECTRWLRFRWPAQRHWDSGLALNQFPFCKYPTFSPCFLLCFSFLSPTLHSFVLFFPSSGALLGLFSAQPSFPSL